MEVHINFKNPRLLVICSSRIRPHMLGEMLESFDKTKSDGTEILIYVSEEDPRLEEYIPFLTNRNYIIGEHRYMAQVINYCSNFFFAEYYQLICDDHLYLTEGWDKKMIEVIEKNGGWGIAYTYDKDDPTKSPTGDFMSGNIVRTLGYFFFPEYRQTGEERYTTDLGNGIGKFFCVENIIEHRCWHGLNKSPRDANHDFIYGEDIAHSIATYNKWRTQHYDNDIRKIKEAMKNEGRSLS